MPSARRGCGTCNKVVLGLRSLVVLEEVVAVASLRRKLKAKLLLNRLPLLETAIAVAGRVT